MKHACGTTRKDLQLVQKEDANALLFTSPPNSACLPGRQISDSSPAVAAAKGGENPSAGAAKISLSTATRSGTGLDGPSRSSRNLRGRKAAAKCLPWSARQCSGRAASSRSPSSRGGASWDAAREPLTPGKRAAHAGLAALPAGAPSTDPSARPISEHHKSTARLLFLSVFVAARGNSLFQHVGFSLRLLLLLGSTGLGRVGFVVAAPKL